MPIYLDVLSDQILQNMIEKKNKRLDKTENLDHEVKDTNTKKIKRIKKITIKNLKQYRQNVYQEVEPAKYNNLESIKEYEVTLECETEIATSYIIDYAASLSNEQETISQHNYGADAEITIGTIKIQPKVYLSNIEKAKITEVISNKYSVSKIVKEKKTQKYKFMVSPKTTKEVFLEKVNIFEEGEILIEKEDGVTKIPFKVFLGTDYNVKTKG